MNCHSLWQGALERREGTPMANQGELRGLRKLMFLRRGGLPRFLLISVWQSMEAMKDFAGDPQRKPNTTREAMSPCWRTEEKVTLYEVFLQI